MTRSRVRTCLAVVILGVSFALIEAVVVVYLRSLYYPHGFAFPLESLPEDHFVAEVFREFATIVVLSTAGYLAGRVPWERIAYVLIVFGVWDCFYYVWLKVILDWPSTLLDWDILFLIPIPWIGPVIAPVLISCVLVAGGVLILIRLARGASLTAGVIPVLLGAAGTAVILWSFMADTGATLHGQMPAPYRYDQLIAGLLLYCAALVVFIRSGRRAPPGKGISP